MNAPTIGFSQFAVDRHTSSTGYSFSSYSNLEIVDLVRENWSKRIPGSGESTVDRKVLVPVPPMGFWCPPVAKLVEGLNVRAEVVARQEGEEPYVENFVTPEDAYNQKVLEQVPARNVNIVVYSAEALTENNGKRTTDCEWEIVCLLCERKGIAPMPPLTMARNFLEESGGTKTDYTAEQFAQSIWYHSIKKGIMIREPRT